MPDKVSVIIPCRNEGQTIRLVLAAFNAQTYPHDLMEIIIVDGFSEDNTRSEIMAFSQEHPELTIRIVDNPKRIIPAAVNAGILASSGDILVRMDAHSIPQPDYVERCVVAHAEGRADNVGGVWDIKPQVNTWMARSIATAASHPLAVGGAQYRFSDKAQYVDTVPYGSFRKALIERIGGFDESLLTNEDYEFNARLIKNGGSVWLDSRIQSTYFARKNFIKLADQYKRYGFWKYQMLRLYPETLRMRQVIPPVFVISLMGLLFLSLFWSIARIILGLVLAIYLGLLLVVSVFESIKRREVCYLYLFVAFAIMHFCWGSSFIYGMISYKKKRII
jgi:glycosyltransferase involved in cell wall biosynthesis